MMAILIGLAIAEPYIDIHQEMEDQALNRMKHLSSQEAYRVAEDFSVNLFPSARIFYELGLRHNQRGDLDEAMKCYERSLTIEPTFQASLYDQAEIYILNSRFSDAKRNLLQISMMESHHWAVDYRLAQIYSVEPNIEKMEFHLKRALEFGLPQNVLKEDRLQWLPQLRNESVAITLEMFLQAIGASEIWENWTDPSKK